jgi:hypothetical protein
MRRIVLGLGLALAAALAAGAVSDATTRSGAAKATWHVTPAINASVTPNYQTGFGPMGGTGSGASPAPGSTAVLDGGYVDFGTLVAGYQYIYKYAAQVNVTTNDANGFKVFAEGTSEFVGSTVTLNMNSVLFWMLSGSSNTQYSAATPFNTTNNTGDLPTNPGPGGDQNVTFLTQPPSSTLIYSSNAQGTSHQGFDYQIRVPDTVGTDQFTATVVYTAVAN